MDNDRYRVAIIGCGILGQEYADIYASLPDAEIVALVEIHPERLKYVGEKYGIRALYSDVNALLNDMVPDIAAIVTPTKYYREAVIACTQAGVKGISTDKPMAARLADADEMVNTCRSRGAVLAGGALMTALPEVQEAATWIHSGTYGKIIGASVHGWCQEISGSGCHTISVLRLLANAEVEEVVAWAEPADILHSDCDWGLTVNAQFSLNNGLHCSAFGHATEGVGLVEVWSEDALIRAGWKAPEIYCGFDENGRRKKVDPRYSGHATEIPGPIHLWGAIRSLLNTLRTGTKLWISGYDLRQALEVAIASQMSAKRGSVPVRLPLENRELALYPRPYRYLGGDHFTGTGEPVEGKRTDLDV